MISIKINEFPLTHSSYTYSIYKTLQIPFEISPNVLVKMYKCINERNDVMIMSYDTHTDADIFQYASDKCIYKNNSIF